MIRVCEELGIVMLVEAFDCWKTPKTRYDYGRFFDEWCERDATEMVLAARNSPAVLMWSIGNEIPDSTSTAGLAMADRIIAAIRAADDTRPLIIGSDKYRRLPAKGSAADLMLAKLDGLGLNYNTAKSVDQLHAAYPHLFLFESESSSETSTRGAYQEPEHLNTGENHTPGRRNTSSYDNNLASWTMSGEYGHKKDRDRKWFAGQFLWSGIDYIGEPTPYDVFPVKASFFGAVDTAGFPKDMYHLFRSQWTEEPMVHLLPMTWNHEKGDTVEVWAYANVPEVELFLNGRSLGTRTFDTKKTTDGRTYLETTEATGDDKTFTDGPYPGSYTSPNGSAGKLHLTWKVPYAPGELKAVARRNGRAVATDVLRTAGKPHAVRLTPDRKSLAADGRSLIFVTADVVDVRGVVVPDTEHLISFAVTGGSLAGVDNGREESAERYQASTRTAFHGKALAIVRAGSEPGSSRSGRARKDCAPAPRRYGPPRPGRPPSPSFYRLHPGPSGAPEPPGRGRQLLRPPGHPPGRDARRRPGHRLVQRLQQGRHRPAARLQRRAGRGLGLGGLRTHQGLRPGRGLLHPERHAQPARRRRGRGVGRLGVSAGRGPVGRLGHGLRPADGDHLRLRARLPDPAHDDERAPGRGGRGAADRQVGAAR